MSRSMVLCTPSLTGSPYAVKSTSHEKERRRGLSLNLGSNLAISAAKNSIYFLGCQSLIHISHGGTKRSFAVCNSVDPAGVPLPSGPPSSSWKWILGMVVTFVLPFLTNKWGPLLKIKNEVEAAVQTVENIVDAVEKVAEEVEKVAEDIAEDLPAGKLKNALEFIENVADQIDDKTELIGDVIDKVQEIEEQVESAVESAIDDSKEHAKELVEAEVKVEKLIAVESAIDESNDEHAKEEVLEADEVKVEKLINN